MQHKTYLIKVRAMKYPIGIQTFDKIRNEGYVYIDKTDMIYSLVTEGQIYFLSRPRRFGKSLLISTLESYFLGREDLFHGLAIEKLEKDWKKYPVIHIDFGAGNFTKETFLDETLNAILSAWEEKYQIKNTLTDFGLRFVNLLNEIHRQTGLRAVVLIDEYDKPLLDVMDLDYKVAFQGTEITLEEYNRNTLKGFYSAFKAADADLQFVFLTGVTKFSQVSVFSGFNQPEDISMSPAFDTLCGITEEELIKYFSEPIKKMSGVYHCSFEDMVRMLMKQYNGYHFSDTMNGVINPFSLLNACKNLRLQDYWFKTGTPTYLARLLSDGINAGPGLMFITLPQVFNAMGSIGGVVGTLFFLLVFFAAITSSISLMETVVSMVRDKFHWNRVVTTVVVTLGTVAIGSLSVLGYGPLANFKIFGMQMLDFFDFISNSVLMPIVAFLTCILIGHVVGTKVIADEVGLSAKFTGEKLHRVMIKWVAPILLVVILVAQVLSAFGIITI